MYNLMHSNMREHEDGMMILTTETYAAYRIRLIRRIKVIRAMNMSRKLSN